MLVSQQLQLLKKVPRGARNDASAVLCDYLDIKGTVGRVLLLASADQCNPGVMHVPDLQGLTCIFRISDLYRRVTNYDLHRVVQHSD